MNSTLFERFLDNLEIYLTIRNSYTDISKTLYDAGKDYYEVEEATEAIQDTLDSQKVILQNIFENMVRESVIKNGDV